MYIVFEGDNGVGKSTQIKRVKPLLENVFDSGSIDKYCMEINIIHEGDSVNGTSDNWYETVLDYARDRASTQHLIKPSHKADITLADRSYYSSMVYQGMDTKQSIDYIRAVNQFALEPDLIILLTDNTDSENYHRYLKILPTGTTFIVNTYHKNEETTTREITKWILYAWIILYLESTSEDAFDLIQHIFEHLEEV